MVKNNKPAYAQSPIASNPAGTPMVSKAIRCPNCTAPIAIEFNFDLKLNVAVRKMTDDEFVKTLKRVNQGGRQG